MFIAVELVDRGEVMLGQDVVDPFLSLLDAGLPSGLEHVGEEILEVLVRQVLLGRDEVVLVLWIPFEFVDPRKTTRVQCDLELQVSMVLREPDRLASRNKIPNRFPSLEFVAILLGFLGLREKRWLGRDRDPSRRSLTLAISSLDWHFCPVRLAGGIIFITCAAIASGDPRRLHRCPCGPTRVSLGPASP